MKSLSMALLMVAAAGFAWSEEPAVAPQEGPTLPMQQVGLELRDQAWFTDTIATAVVEFPELVESPETLPEAGDGVDFISVDVVEAEEGGGSAATIRWLPRREGLVLFPALEFQSGKTRFQSPDRQVMVSAPQRSSDMELMVTPGKSRIYAGEPLRLDVKWTCSIPAKRVRAMHCDPQFFNDPKIEVVVPRSSAPEEEQLGVPFGGRRVIARRSLAKDAEPLGEVAFPVFLRFAEPGDYTLPPVRLEVAELRDDGGTFAPYAAFFNNGLFEPVNQGAAYHRVFVETGPIGIEVLPLPEQGRLESFSGLFAPCSIGVSVKPLEGEVGQLLEADILVRSKAPHGLLELPDLRRQKSLRSWFKVDRELGRAWHREGTGFRARVRALTTEAKAFPGLEFQLFDPDKGDYVMLRTEPVPITVLPRDGRDYFDVKTLGKEAASLSDQPEGIWQNAEATTMNELLNTLGNLLADHFWLLLALGPVLFLVLLPVAREGRRRALSPDYRRRQDALRAFRRLPEGRVEKWRALRNYLATSLGVDPKAWTSGDARRLLAEHGVREDDIDLIVKCEESLDAESFSVEKQAASLPKLNPVTQRIAKVLGKTAMLLLAVLLTGPASAADSDWEEATELFSQALAEEAAPDEAAALYARAALKFEAAAQSGRHAGRAWYNAGNAWFQAGEVGRSIACQRQAQVYLPFSRPVRDNLDAARALAVDVVEDRRRASWLRWPMRWLRAVLVPVWLGFWALLLGYLRFRRPAWLVGCGCCLVVALAVGTLAVLAKRNEGRDGVVVAPEVFGRKGPSYRYRTAFNEPLHDGLEFVVVGKGDDWLQIELSDERRCWIPDSQARLVSNR